MMRPFALLLAIALVRCGEDVGPEPNPTRSYAMASAGARLVIAPQPAIVLDATSLASDVDAVVVHQEFYGLPWDAFVAGEEPPAEWVALMDGLVADAGSVGPVVLSLQMVSGGGRTFLADRAVVVDGVVGTQVGWSAPCYDFSSAPDASALRAGYLAYVDWMMRRFTPRWINVAIEMNMFAAACSESAWDALVDLERDAYDTAKAVDPEVIAFPSFQLELLYGFAGCAGGDRDVCFATAYAKLERVKRDRFAVTSLPFLVERLRDPGVLPGDWFTRAGDMGGEQTIVAEAGWLAAPMNVTLGTSCLEALPGDEEKQLLFFDKLMAEVVDHGIELVTWISNRDLVDTPLMSDCPCDYDADWCGFLDGLRQSAGSDPNAQASAEYSIKQFGAMGLRRYDGTPREPFLSHWQALRADPYKM